MNKPLTNLTLLNTRPHPQELELEEQVKQLGGKCINFPLLEIKATKPTWLKALEYLNQYQFAIFTSPNAVNFAFKYLKPEHFTPRCIAIGQATCQALSTLGLPDILTPTIPDSENLLKLPELTKINDKHILLVKGLKGRPLIRETLKQRGSFVTELDVYERSLPNATRLQCLQVWQQPITACLLSSIESLNNALILFAENKLKFLNTPCIVLSNRIKEAAIKQGIKNILVAKPHTMTETLIHWYEKSR